MRSILSLFAHSPFRDFKRHMAKIEETVAALDPVFKAVFEGENDQVLQAAKRVSQLEHEADVIKNELRDNMPATLFMPVDRSDLISLLAAEDAIADCAEDIAVLLTLRPFKVHEFMREDCRLLIDRTMTCFAKSVEIIHHFDALLEASFRGPKRDEVLKLVGELNHMEHLADKAQDKLLKSFFRHEDELKPAEILLWPRVIAKIGDLANESERMGNRVRLLLAK